MEANKQSLEDAVSVVASAIANDPPLSFLLAYNCFAITGDLIHDIMSSIGKADYYGESIKPLIGIYGKNAHVTSTMVGNIFCNFFDVVAKKENSISGSWNVNIMNPDTFDKSEYKDIPVLIFRNKIINRYHLANVNRLLKSNRIYFPVIISKVDLEQDNSFYLDVRELKKLPGDADALTQIRTAMDRMIHDFIVFCKNGHDAFVSCIAPQINRKIDEIENDNTIAEPLGHCAMPLYAAFLLLNRFLSSKKIDFSSPFSAFENYIRSKIRCVDVPEAEPTSLEQTFVRYVRDVFCGQHKVEYVHTDASTGAHLHLEIMLNVNDTYTKPLIPYNKMGPAKEHVNPIDYLP
jgi:hypothetical protein